MQDLKTGNLVGSTPFKQQIMQISGLIVPGILLPLVLNLVLQAYGIGEPTEQVCVFSFKRNLFHFLIFY